jgi:hypothetical protein
MFKNLTGRVRERKGKGIVEIYKGPDGSFWGKSC